MLEFDSVRLTIIFTYPIVRVAFRQPKEVLTMSKPILKPGQHAPASGQYGILGPRGGKTGVERTVVAGEPLPPPPAAGQKYILVDKTKTK